MSTAQRVLLARVASLSSVYDLKEAICLYSFTIRRYAYPYSLGQARFALPIPVSQGDVVPAGPPQSTIHQSFLVLAILSYQATDAYCSKKWTPILINSLHNFPHNRRQP